MLPQARHAVDRRAGQEVLHDVPESEGPADGDPQRRLLVGQVAQPLHRRLAARHAPEVVLVGAVPAPGRGLRHPLGVVPLECGGGVRQLLEP